MAVDLLGPTYINSNGRPRTWGERLKGIVLLISNRIWRGGPRFLLQVAACVVVLFLLLNMVPTRLSDGYQSILDWSHPMPAVAHDLRIVVFGSQDLAGSAVPLQAESSRMPWTAQLCKAMNCTSFLSFVPSSDTGPALASNSIYGGNIDEIRKKYQDDDVAQNPASDYQFLFDQYPVHDNIPDLDAQIQKFLALPPPTVAPRQTLWIFTFGTWDIWNLASLPRKIGEQGVDAYVSHIFSRVEQLYIKALDPTSVAFSDFWSNATKQEIRRYTAPDAASRVDERKLESFRILIPELFDVTLTPAWHVRPSPPFPHSKAEQMRNAAFLTKRWNSRMEEELREWKAKTNSKPAGINEDEVHNPVSVPEMDSLLNYLPAALQPEKAAKTSIDKVINAPYPRRNGLKVSSAAPILDAMTEEEMQRSGLKDSKGRGSLPATASMRFLDVWTPCLQGDLRISGVETGSASACEQPGDHLFHDPYTVSQRAIDNIASEMATTVLNKLFPPQQRRGWITK